MDHAAAEAEAERLNQEHPDREKFHWSVAGNDEKGWSVARFPLLQGKKLDPLKTTIEAKPEPNPAEDPRDSFQRNVPPDTVG